MRPSHSVSNQLACLQELCRHRPEFTPASSRWRPANSTTLHLSMPVPSAHFKFAPCLGARATLKRISFHTGNRFVTRLPDDVRQTIENAFQRAHSGPGLLAENEARFLGALAACSPGKVPSSKSAGSKVNPQLCSLPSSPDMAWGGLSPSIRTRPSPMSLLTCRTRTQPSTNSSLLLADRHFGQFNSLFLSNYEKSGLVEPLANSSCFQML